MAAGKIAGPVLPLNEVKYESVGISAETRDLKVGTPVDPFGDAYTKFAVCVFFVKVKVPAPVTGDPVTVNSAGAVKPTLVTVPEVKFVFVHFVPLYVSPWPVVGETIFTPRLMTKLMNLLFVQSNSLLMQVQWLRFYY